MAQTTLKNLPDHSVCRSLTGLTVEAVAKSGVRGQGRQFQKADSIWRADDKADSIFFLRRGKAAILACDADGRETILRLIEAGEPFGELCFCAAQNGTRQTTARALMAGEAVEIKFIDFLDYLRESGEELLSFVFTFCTRLSHCERQIEILSFRGAEERIGWLLIRLAEEGGKSDGVIELDTSHREIAQMTAMTRSHVTVMLGEFRRRRLIEYGRRQPLRVNLDALREFLIDGKLKRKK